MVITNPILQLKKVSISYTPGKNAVEEVSADIAEKNHGYHGTLRMWKEYLVTGDQPDARIVPGYQDHGRDSPKREKYIKDKPHGSTTHGGNGIPTPEPVPHDEHL